jgi:hypothetical protein
MKTENLTLLEAARAVLEGKRVETRFPDTCWIEWDGLGWNRSWQARIGFKPKRTRKVKMLAWLANSSLIWRAEDFISNSEWKRAPAEDKEIEVEDV